MANDAKNVYVGKPVTGAVATAAVGTTAPTSAGATLGDAWTATGFVDQNGVTLSQNRSTTDLKAWGGTTVRTLLDEFTGTVKYAEMETTYETMCRMVGPSNVQKTVADDSHGMQLKVSLKAELPEPCAWCFSMKDGDRRLRIYIPNGQLTEVSDTTFVHNDAVKWDFTIKANDDGNGNTIIILTDDGQVISDTDTDTDTDTEEA